MRAVLALMALASLLSVSSPRAEGAPAKEPEHNNVQMVIAGSMLTYSGISLLATGAPVGVAVTQATDDAFIGPGFLLGMIVTLIGYGSACAGVPLWMVGNAPAPSRGFEQRNRALYAMGIAVTSIGVAAVPPGVYLLATGINWSETVPQGRHSFELAGAVTLTSAAAVIGGGVAMYLWGRELEPQARDSAVSVSISPVGVGVSF